MIVNFTLDAYKYDLYSKIMTREHYSLHEMKNLRKRSIEKAKLVTIFGLIMIRYQLKHKLNQFNNIVLLVAIYEISPQKVDQFPQVDL
jgi:diphthamide biosynthesis enzyme Dph1/Dph2-like protein